MNNSFVNGFRALSSWAEETYIETFADEDLAAALQSNPGLRDQLAAMRANLPDDIEGLILSEDTDVGALSLIGDDGFEVPAIAGNPTAMAQLVEITANEGLHELLRDNDVGAIVQRMTSGMTDGDADPAQQAATISQLHARLEQNPQMFRQINDILDSLPQDMRAEIMAELTTATPGSGELPAILGDPERMATLQRMVRDPAVIGIVRDQGVIGLLERNGGDAPISGIEGIVDAYQANPEIAADIGRITSNPGFRAFMEELEGVDTNPTLAGTQNILQGILSGADGSSVTNSAEVISGLADRLEQNPEMFNQLREIMEKQPAMAQQILQQFATMDGDSVTGIEIPEILGNQQRMADLVTIASDPSLGRLLDVELPAADGQQAQTMGSFLMSQLTEAAAGNGDMIQRLAAQVRADAAAKAQNSDHVGVIERLAEFVENPDNADMTQTVIGLMQTNPEAAGNLVTVATAEGFPELMDMIQNDERFAALKAQLMDGDELDPEMIEGLARQLEQNDQFFVQMRDMMNRRPGLMNSAATMMSLMGQNGSLDGLDPSQGMSMMLAMDQLLNVVGSFLGPEAAGALEGMLGQFMEGFAPMLAQVREIGGDLATEARGFMASTNIVPAADPAAEPLQKTPSVDPIRNPGV